MNHFSEDSLFKLKMLLRSWINDKTVQASETIWLQNSLCPGTIERKVFADWEELLNRLKIKRIEHHLPYKPPQKGYIRMQDPYCIGINRKRDIEIHQDMAMKILTLGLP